jgi:hypothetical protein
VGTLIGSAWLRPWTIALGFVALAFALTWRLWTPIAVDRRWVQAGDFQDQFYPFAAHVAAELRAGRLPLWNPYVFGGHPFQADPQTALFYPLSSLLALALGGGGLGYRELELELPLHFALAAIGTFLLARRLTGDDLAGCLAGIAYGFSGFLTSYPAQQLAMLRTAAWIPWLLLCLDRALGPDGRPVWLVGAGGAAGMLLLAGHTQTALFGFYLAAAYALWRARAVGRTWPTALLGAVAPLLLGAALAAVQLLPTLEFVALSTRDRLPYDEAAYGYELKALAGTLLPGWRGEKALYAGVPTLVLAAIAAAGWRGPPRFWAVVAAIALLVSVGGRTFLYQAMFLAAPGWGTFRDQERTAGVLTLALALLGAYGLARLRAAEPEQWRRWLRRLGLATAAAGALALQVLVLWTSRRLDDVNPYAELFEASVFLLIVLGLGLVAFARRSPALLVGLLLFDLFSVNAANNLSAVDPRGVLVREGALTWARATGEPYRVRADDDRKVPPNFAMLWRTPFMAGDSPIQLRRTNSLLRTDEEYRLWQLFNVKYLLSGAERSDPGLEPLGRVDDLHVYGVRFSLPRAWAVSDVRLAASPAESLRAVLDPPFHPGDVAVVEETPPLHITPGLPRPDVRVEREEAQQVELRVTSTGNALLVVADAWHPGWRAYLDGAPTPLLRTNHAFRGVAVPPGDHRVDMRYEPLSLRVGAGVTAVAVIVAIALWLRWRGRSWPSPSL